MRPLRVLRIVRVLCVFLPPFDSAERLHADSDPPPRLHGSLVLLLRVIRRGKSLAIRYARVVEALLDLVHLVLSILPRHDGLRHLDLAAASCYLIITTLNRNKLFIQ